MDGRPPVLHIRHRGGPALPIPIPGRRLVSHRRPLCAPTLWQIELREQFYAVTLDIIGLAGFGYDFHAISNKQTELQQAFRK